MTDDPGVMGNLPRSRPGRRSEKRAAEVKPAKPKASAKGAAAAKPKKAAAKAGTASAKRAGATARSKSKPRVAASKPRAKSGPRAAGARPRGPAATTPSVGIRSEDQAPPTAVRNERVEESQGSDPITAAIRLGMSVGDAGLKVVAKLAQRLPRP